VQGRGTMVFLFESRPLNEFLPHVTDLGKELEKLEDNQMEEI
jgi:hypothetical protein